MRLLQSTDLDRWADTIASKSEFPRIVKRLICAVVQPDKLRFPSGDSVWVPGLDGVVAVREGCRFVPTGISVWEVGAGQDFIRKANADYNKRSSKPLPMVDIAHSEATFVFVTPRVWQEKENWAAERKKGGIFADVWVIDGVELEDWLESAPGVTLQLTHMMGFPKEHSFKSLDQAWDEWTRLSSPPLTESVVLAGRAKEEQAVVARLKERSNTFTIRCDSSREAIGFALAAIRRVPDHDELESLSARTIVVERADIAARLPLRNHIVLLTQVHDPVSGSLEQRGCHVIIPEGADPRTPEAVIVLPRPTHAQFREALLPLSLRDDCDQIARDCGRSVTVFQRLNPHANYANPEWATPEQAQLLAAVLLAGRWDECNDADRQTMTKLSARSDYDSFIAHVQPFQFVDEPPLRKIDTVWTLTAPVDAFQLIARHLTKTEFDRFADAFVEVFSARDPRVGLHPDEWLIRDLQDSTRHSSWLRAGLAETLRLIAIRGTKAYIACLPSPQSFVDETVLRVPGLKNDWRVVASMTDEFTRLMEGAPDPLLATVEQLLEAQPSDIGQIFREGGMFGGGALHPGILWGLELLAWSPEYLPRVVRVLARLAQIDPGGRLMNRPVNTLAEIFSWWHPGTNARTGEKLCLLSVVFQRQASVAWDLVARLLPSGSMTSTATQRPQWRDFGDIPEDCRSRTGQLKYLDGIGGLALDNVGAEPTRWKQLLDALAFLSSERQGQALDLLRHLSLSCAADTKSALWHVVFGYVQHQRVYGGDGYVPSPEFVERLSITAELLAPEDVIERNRWLFDDYSPRIRVEDSNPKNRAKAVNAARIEATERIIERTGFSGLVKLALSCRYPGFLSSSVLHVLNDPDAVWNLILSASSNGQPGLCFASQLSGDAFRILGQDWTSFVTAKSGDEVQGDDMLAWVVMTWPSEARPWRFLDRLSESARETYWRHRQILELEGPADTVRDEIEALIRVGRAVDLLAPLALRPDDVSTSLLFVVLDGVLERLAAIQSKEEMQQLGSSGWEIRQIFDELEKRSDVEIKELVRREYQLLPLLGYSESKELAIHRFLLQDAEVFVEVIEHVYRPHHRDKAEEPDPTPQQQTRASVGHQLLRGLSKLPGATGEQDINEAKLANWIEQAIAMATEIDRAEVCKIHIGQLLAHAPVDPIDNAWPHQAVRNTLERFRSEEIERGFAMGRFDLRGTYSKAVYEGGDQERALAKQFREWAMACEVGWSRVTGVLREMAKVWEEDARREDARAEHDSMR